MSMSLYLVMDQVGLAVSYGGFTAGRDGNDRNTL